MNYNPKLYRIFTVLSFCYLAHFSSAQIIIASDDFNTSVNLLSRSNTTDQGTFPNHEDPFTMRVDDFFGISDGVTNSSAPRRAPFAFMDDAADVNCPNFFPGDVQGILPCDYGNNFFGVLDTENGENMGEVSATWIFDISEATGGLSTICIDMGAMGDYEMNDMHTWTAAIDGGSALTIFELMPDESTSAMYDITNPQTLNDPMAINGALILNGLTTFCADLTSLGAGDQLTLILTSETDGAVDPVVYDNIVVNGIVPVPTIGQWALIILGLMMSILGLVFVKRHSISLGF